MSTLVPMMSAGIRSGVNWMRLNEQSMTSASVRTSIVLPSPGTPSSSAWPLAMQADQRLADEFVLADDDLLDLALDRPGAVGESSTDSSVAARRSTRFGWVMRVSCLGFE